MAGGGLAEVVTADPARPASANAAHAFDDYRAVDITEPTGGITRAPMAHSGTDTTERTHPTAEAAVSLAQQMSNVLQNYLSISQTQAQAITVHEE